MYVCLCKAIREYDLRRVAETGSLTPSRFVRALGLDDEQCCGRCAENVEELVALARAQLEQG
jgi:bacterioferritin-associated ferredoxin